MSMKIHLDLENCYGIKALKADFDFSKGRVFALYAPNGSMKSSLAQTFADIAKGEKSKDRIFPTRETKRSVTEADGSELSRDSVLVIRPYDEALTHSEKTSTLLVNATLRNEYEALHREVDECKGRLIEALQAQSGSKRDVEKEISATFTRRDNNFVAALQRIRAEVDAQTDAPLSHLAYDVIFDEKVLSVLDTKDFKSAIGRYIEKYNELLEKSTYFKKGLFNYYNASSIAKALSDHGFFKAKHKLTLVADENVEIDDEDSLVALVNKEKEGITNDKDLKKTFAALSKLLEKNVTVRDFQAYIENHSEVLPGLSNIEGFREDVWKSYLVANRELFNEFLSKVAKVATRKAEIEKKAGEERTQWQEAIEIFNDRFFVPFKLVEKNIVSVVLGVDPIVSLGFEFRDGEEAAPVEKSELLQVLSTGERKALYVLNIIFEFQVRRKVGQRTLLVIDDIADSFDYRNKYAIIQYLKEISEEDNFYQLILTHNFDFFRTIESRIARYSQCLMVSKNANGLVLTKAAGIKNVFVNDWKKHFFTDARKRVASIPFVRNIVEYTRGEDTAEYGKLTSLLHWKRGSAEITQGDLAELFESCFGYKSPIVDEHRKVVDVIWELADQCLSADLGPNLENKIVLSIAIRLWAERFMIEKIADDAFVESIASNQTFELLRRFRGSPSGSDSSCKILDRVLLMTPENIHLNSFMYEPILDMSDEHLRKLYVDVKALA